MTKNSGYIVETKEGKTGRTFHSKGFVNKKQPVYLATEYLDKALPDGTRLKTPVKFSDTALLCEPTTLKIIGFTD